MSEVADKPQEKTLAAEKPVEEPTKSVETEISEENDVEKSAEVGTESDVSKLEADIIRQIEYYFGDANLRKDKFLLEQINKDEEGWVPFTVLFTFKRMASLSTDVDLIIKALLKSEENLVEFSEDRTKVRRNPEKPIPEHNDERKKEIMSRSAFVKGFPMESEMSDLIEFFNPFEKVLNINMRKYYDKPADKYKFKGSVFVTFAKKEQCEEFINKEKVEYKGTDLIRKWQELYLEEKRKDDRSSRKRSKQKEKEDEKFELPKGAILHFEGCDENITRETIREGLQEIVASLDTEIAFIEYNKGEKNGYVRLSTENAAHKVLEKLENKKLKVNGTVELLFKSIGEDEETEFLKKAVEHMKFKRNHCKHKGNRKRKVSDKTEEEPPIKQKH